MGLQGRDQQRPGRPALVAELKAQAFLVSCYYLSRTDSSGSGQGICGLYYIAAGHRRYRTELLIGGGCRPTNAGVISNNYLKKR